MESGHTFGMCLFSYGNTPHPPHPLQMVSQAGVGQYLLMHQPGKAISTDHTYGGGGGGGGGGGSFSTDHQLPLNFYRGRGVGLKFH